RVLRTYLSIYIFPNLPYFPQLEPGTGRSMLCFAIIFGSHLMFRIDSPTKFAAADTTPTEGNHGACGASDLHQNLNIVNLCKDAVRIEAFSRKDGIAGEGYQTSGTLMSDRGDIVTSDHGTTASNIQKVDIQFSNGEHRKAHLLVRDEASGLAVFRVNDNEK